MKLEGRNERLRYILDRIRSLHNAARDLSVKVGGVIDNLYQFSTLEDDYKDIMDKIEVNVKSIGYAFDSARRELEEKDEN